MTKKKGLKGFSSLVFFPLVSDTATEYKTEEEPIKMIGARSGNFSDNRTDFNIPGDDGTYDSGSEWEYTDVEVVVNEMDLVDLGKFAGATAEETKTAIEEGIFDIPTSGALGYRALRRDGGYRCFRYYHSTLLSYSVNHETKGSNSDGQAYTLRFRCVARIIDGKIRGTEDVTNAKEAEEWLASIPTVTAA